MALFQVEEAGRRWVLEPAQGRVAGDTVTPNGEKNAVIHSRRVLFTLLRRSFYSGCRRNSPTSCERRSGAFPVRPMEPSAATCESAFHMNGAIS